MDTYSVYLTKRPIRSYGPRGLVLGDYGHEYKTRIAIDGRESDGRDFVGPNLRKLKAEIRTFLRNCGETRPANFMVTRVER